MKKLIILIPALVLLASCKKKEEVKPECSSSFTNEVVSNINPFHLDGIWKMNAQFTSPCKDDIILISQEMEIEVISGTALEVIDGNYHLIEIGDDKLTFTSTGKTYDVWEFSSQKLVIGTPDLQLKQFVR